MIVKLKVKAFVWAFRGKGLGGNSIACKWRTFRGLCKHIDEKYKEEK